MRLYLPEHGERRVRKTFLLYPMTLENEKRWLEIAYILEQYHIAYGSMTWNPIKFVDKDFKL